MRTTIDYTKKAPDESAATSAATRAAQLTKFIEMVGEA